MSVFYILKEISWGEHCSRLPDLFDVALYIEKIGKPGYDDNKYLYSVLLSHLLHACTVKGNRSMLAYRGGWTRVMICHAHGLKISIPA